MDNNPYVGPRSFQEGEKLYGRELQNTLLRAAVLSTNPHIEADDVRQALFAPVVPTSATVLNRPLGKGLSLPAVMGQVAQHYLQRALAEAHGNKSEAAQLIGLPSYQTLTNWLKKYKVGSGTIFDEVAKRADHAVSKVPVSRL